jgi:hypothetical protein
MEDVTIPQHTIIQYVRTHKNIPRGVLVAVKCGDGFRLGYSFCNKKDRFNKRMALKIAFGRADAIYKSMDMSPNGWFGEHTPHPVKKMIPAFLDRCNKYYKVTR